MPRVVNIPDGAAHPAVVAASAGVNYRQPYQPLTPSTGTLNASQYMPPPAPVSLQSQTNGVPLPANAVAYQQQKLPGQQPPPQQTTGMSPYKDASGNPIPQHLIDESLAANPQASPGGYMGPTPMPEPQHGDFISWLNGDPMYALAHAQTLKERSDAAAAEIQQYQNALLQFGDEGLARESLQRLYANPDIMQALGPEQIAALTKGLDAFVQQVHANADEFTGLSTTAKNLYNYHQQGRSADEGLNEQNLFYSGARVSALENLGRQYAFQTAGDRSTVSSLLTGSANDFTAALANATSQDLAAAQSAYEDWLSQAQQGAPSGDTPPSNTPIPNTPAAKGAPAAKPKPKPLPAAPTGYAPGGVTYAPPKKKPLVYGGRH